MSCASCTSETCRLTIQSPWLFCKRGQFIRLHKGEREIWESTGHAAIKAIRKHSDFSGSAGPKQTLHLEKGLIRGIFPTPTLLTALHSRTGALLAYLHITRAPWKDPCPSVSHHLSSPTSLRTSNMANKFNCYWGENKMNCLRLHSLFMDILIILVPFQNEGFVCLNVQISIQSRV